MKIEATVSGRSWVPLSNRELGADEASDNNIVDIYLK